jgi:hypothetical protein
MFLSLKFLQSIDSLSFICRDIVLNVIGVYVHVFLFLSLRDLLVKSVISV